MARNASSFPHRSLDTPGGPRALSLSGRDTLRQPANLHQSPVDDLHLPKVGILCMCVLVWYMDCVQGFPCIFVCASMSVWDRDCCLCLYLCVRHACGRVKLSCSGRGGLANLTSLPQDAFFFEALLLTESQIWVLIKQAPQLLFYHPVAEQRSRGLWNRKCTIK